MLRIGLIGLGPDWEQHYRPALEGLTRRLRIAAVYDTVASRAEQLALEFGAVPCTGLRRLLDRPDVAAVLLLDTAWHGESPLQMAVDYGKPTFLGGGCRLGRARMEELHARAQAAGVLIVPELRLRATPASMRLRELTATRLGPVESLRVELGASAAETLPGTLAAALDWCAYAAQSTPCDLEDVAAPHAAAGRELTVRFRRHTTQGAPVSAVVRVTASIADGDWCGVPPIHVRVECANGSVDVTSPSELSWRSGSETVHERLTSERPSGEVLLGHFARRIVGGLVPVPDLEDLCRPLRLLEACAGRMTGSN
jgi:predicted dehydrogenase